MTNVDECNIIPLSPKTLQREPSLGPQSASVGSQAGATEKPTIASASEKETRGANQRGRRGRAQAHPA